ncbi:hypothetical protein HW932_21115 [Allochromatium humboldtianum]|uniref:Uncharacterized protein n=1 Tax=Allochromatium humboldtianum TaxID=504901 RepID=A0A850RQF1_9GAMM|nr:hypothetical protein [Allochromatium humboldtianum]
MSKKTRRTSPNLEPKRCAKKLASLNRQIKTLESIEFKLMTVWLLLWGCELTLAMLSYLYPSP